MQGWVEVWLGVPLLGSRQEVRSWRPREGLWSSFEFGGSVNLIASFLKVWSFPGRRAADPNFGDTSGQRLGIVNESRDCMEAQVHCVVWG